VGDGCPEERHHRISDELLHRATVSLELGAEARVVGGEDRPYILGIELFRAVRKADEIAEEHRDDLSLLSSRWGGGSERRAAHAAEAEALGVLLTAVRTVDHAQRLRRCPG
jgi:hypothetical protein